MEMLTRHAAADKNHHQWMKIPRNHHCCCLAILPAFKQGYPGHRGITLLQTFRGPGMLKPGDGESHWEEVSLSHPGFCLYEFARAALRSDHRPCGLHSRDPWAQDGGVSVKVLTELFHSEVSLPSLQMPPSCGVLTWSFRYTCLCTNFLVL